MPTYQYLCDFCRELTEITHSIDETLDKCPICETEKQMRKVPSTITIMKHKEQLKQEYEKLGLKPGEVVKQSISDIKQDVEQEKEILKQRLWKPPI